MFNFSGSEIVFLLLIALIVLGPEKLPEAVRKFGKTYAEFKKMTTGFQSELKSALDEPMREMRETADAFKKAASFDFDAEPDAPAEETSEPTAEAIASPPAQVEETPIDVAKTPADTPLDDEPVVTGLDAVIVRDAPVQGGVEARVPPARPASVPATPSIAAPVERREPRKNTAASFRRAAKNHAVPAEPDHDPNAGSAPPLAPRPGVDADDADADDADNGRAAGA